MKKIYIIIFLFLLTGKIHPEDDQVVELGHDFMKLWVENMFSITTVSFKKFVTTDTYYWTGFPTSENAFVQPLYWFGGGRFTFQHVDSATRNKSEQ